MQLLNELTALKQLVQEAYLASLFHYSKNLLGYHDITERTHMRNIRLLEADLERKMGCVPRGTFKSSIFTVAYPMWRLEKNPNLRILIDSEIYTNSKNFLREIRGHYESEAYQAVFGDKRSDTWTEGEIIISTRTKILKEASITASGIGAQKTSQHYDIIIFDDVNGPTNSATAEQRDKVIAHYQMAQSLLDPGGEFIVVGTRYHENDLIGWIIKNEMGYATLDEMKKVPKDKGVRIIQPQGLIGV
jgi:hypothetical protein